MNKDELWRYEGKTEWLKGCPECGFQPDQCQCEEESDDYFSALEDAVEALEVAKGKSKNHLFRSGIEIAIGEIQKLKGV